MGYGGRNLPGYFAPSPSITLARAVAVTKEPQVMEFQVVIPYQASEFTDATDLGLEMVINSCR